MDVSYRPYYRVNEYLLSCIGQWPYQSKFKQHLITYTISFDIVILLIAEILGLANSWGDVDKSIDCIPPFFFNLVSIVCLIACSINKEKMTLLLSKIKNDWSIWTSGPEVEILRDYASQGRKFVVVYSILIYVNMVDFIAVPLIPSFLDLVQPLNESRPKRAIIVTEYFVDPEDNYYWIALHACITTTLLMTVIVSVDAIFIVFLYHACGEMAILGFKLKNLVKKDDSESNIDKTQIQREIKFCVEKHEAVIICVCGLDWSNYSRFVNDISDYFSTAYFLVLGLNMMMMSVTGVQTVMNLDQPREAYTYAVFALGELFHLFCLTIPCQYLIDHSLQISQCIYDGYWYQMSYGSQKMLLMIMMRSTKPCSFTAGKLYTFSMENFAAVVRTSMSYFTVLSSVRE